jgi:CDGSH-type Zn-finger protein
MKRNKRKRSRKARFIPLQDGPFLYEKEGARGGVLLYDSSGQRVPCGRKAYLCRCGASANGPFCDGSHTRIGFSGRRETDGHRDRSLDYEGQGIIINDNRSICSHAAYCWKGLPTVFKVKSRPWIEPRGARAEEIKAVIERCPSGALSYRIDGIEQQDPDRDPAVTIEEKGPYRLAGHIEVTGSEWPAGVSGEHCCCCRCGTSKNKPFCDGSHDNIEYP